MKTKLRIFTFCLSILGAFWSFSIFAQDANDAFSVQQQFGMSIDQIRHAAEQGDPDAEYALGYMYYYGKGTPRDEQAARMWIQKAAAQGQPQAVKAVQMLGITGQPKAASVEQKKEETSKGKVTPSIGESSSNTNVMNIANSNAAPSATNSPSNSTSASTSTNNSASNDDTTAVNNSAVTDSTAANNNSMDNSVAATGNPDQPAQITPNTQTTQKHKNTISKRDNSSGNYSQSLSKNKLLTAPAHYYTIQLLGSYEKSDITSYINAHHLQNKATYYRTTFSGKPWYVLVYGIYPTDAEAKSAIARLPEGIKKLNPWVKPVASVQAAMRSGQEVG